MRTLLALIVGLSTVALLFRSPLPIGAAGGGWRGCASAGMVPPRSGGGHARADEARYGSLRRARESSAPAVPVNRPAGLWDAAPSQAGVVLVPVGGPAFADAFGLAGTGGTPPSSAAIPRAVALAPAERGPAVLTVGGPAGGGAGALQIVLRSSPEAPVGPLADQIGAARAGARVVARYGALAIAEARWAIGLPPLAALMIRPLTPCLGADRTPDLKHLSAP